MRLPICALCGIQDNLRARAIGLPVAPRDLRILTLALPPDLLDERNESEPGN
jgi:hypothetical protein